MAHLLISAAHKSSGKTVLSLGICAALREKGLNIQAFKKGPDYIDAIWLKEASGRSCYNLDFWTQSKAEIRSMFATHSLNTDISIIEGNKGLHDGLATDGSNSNAALAKLIDAPVVLVLDTRGTIRGVAPLVLGYQQFDPEINIAGIILNFVGGNRHAAKLTAALEHYTDIPILGTVQRSAELELVERYLGLMPSNEDKLAQEKILRIAKTLSQQIDLDRLVEIANTTATKVNKKNTNVTPTETSHLKVAYAKDEAFGFYYADDLDTFAQHGAELLAFDTLQDSRLPEAAHALFIGGGFPEKRMQQLAANKKMKQSIQNAIEQGMPAYAECGGLMYLCKSIIYNSEQAEMVGIIQADCEMHTKPIGRGYTLLENDSQHPWPNCSNESIPGHEFHYSKLNNIPTDTTFAYQVKRGFGVNGEYDGIVHKNLLACYAHQRNTLKNQWIPNFINFVKTCD